jgi:hypothetical protein
MQLSVNFTPLKKKKIWISCGYCFHENLLFKKSSPCIFFGHCLFLFIYSFQQGISNKMSHTLNFGYIFECLCVVPADISSFHHIAHTINNKKIKRIRKICAGNKKFQFYGNCVAQQSVCTQVRCQVRHNMCVFNHMYSIHIITSRTTPAELRHYWI